MNDFAIWILAGLLILLVLKYPRQFAFIALACVLFWSPAAMRAVRSVFWARRLM